MRHVDALFRAPVRLDHFRVDEAKVRRRRVGKTAGGKQLHAVATDTAAAFRHRVHLRAASRVFRLPHGQAGADVGPAAVESRSYRAIPWLKLSRFGGVSFARTTPSSTVWMG